ncbi:tRNA 5-hydroxyuridine methyltransferase [Paenibacillus allorhizoplanae]|uniref:tRNA 5-hydroxyuridine methyltransferase n=1 Tax=Paenibacillus allorhizoplanae TaxID=2905648 RepID=A0ABM9CXK9_9BACL|nr:class I SAM-dependent methyltransferase [Paenibacillus allorhizoplanae]CAH1225555.1 tRNA 5-hydroxyuridine methyltransferase [Paenibacillus allorhizoplanae]
MQAKMLQVQYIRKPEISEIIAIDAEAMGFKMSCDLETASLLRTLAGSCKNGMLLELGTGAGISTSWILDGMDRESSLLTVELDETIHNIAKKHLSFDNRVQFYNMDGEEFIKQISNQKFDFIFADTWPGKFYALDEALDLLKPGGLYIIDDLLPIPSWPDEHTTKVEELIGYLDSREDLIITKLNWSTGLIIATKK